MNMKPLLTIFVLILMMGGVNGQPALPSTVDGYVSVDGVPLEYTTVDFTNVNTGEVIKVTTDQGGYYQIVDLDGGGGFVELGFITGKRSQILRLEACKGSPACVIETPIDHTPYRLNFNGGSKELGSAIFTVYNAALGVGALLFLFVTLKYFLPLLRYWFRKDPNRAKKMAETAVKKRR